jgi:alpha-tubulin suppressor-like RCC1 family protein
MRTGSVQCWGKNTRGQLGNGSGALVSTTPTTVQGLASNVAAISAGSFHACALGRDGEVKCWGQNTRGQLGDGSTNDHDTPIAIEGMDNAVAAISLGYEYSCSITRSGAIKCWGSNNEGQLGDGSAHSVRLIPVDLASSVM